MILIWIPGHTRPKQYFGLTDNQVKALVDRGHQVYRFDGALWRFMTYEGDTWKEVEIAEGKKLLWPDGRALPEKEE